MLCLCCRSNFRYRESSSAPGKLRRKKEEGMNSREIQSGQIDVHSSVNSSWK